VSARILWLVSLPVVTRLYSPDDFIVLSVFIAFVTVLIPLCTLQYTAAIPVVDTDTEAATLFGVVSVFAILSALVMSGILLALGSLFNLGETFSKVRTYIWMLPIALIATSVWDALNYWGTRKRAFNTLAKGMFIQSLNGALIMIGLGIAGLVPVGLLIGQIVSQGGGVAFLWRRFSRDLMASRSQVTVHAARHLLATHWRYPSLIMPSLFLNSFLIQMPTLYVAATHDAATAGNFGLAWTMLLLPVRLLAKPVSRVFYAHSAEMGRQDAAGIRRLLIVQGGRILAVLIPANIVFYLAAPWLFPIVFGTGWDLAGQIAAQLSVFLTAMFLYSTLNQVLNVVGRQAVRLQLEVQNLGFLVLLAIWVGFTDPGLLHLVTVYALVMLLHYAICIARLFQALSSGRASKTSRRGPE